MIVHDSSRRPVTLGPELYHGGEGVIYAVQGRADQVAKIYAPALPQGYAEKLAWMKANPPVDPGRSMGHASIAWPSDLLVDGSGKVAGYLMPYIRNTAPALAVFNPRTRARTLPGFSWRYLHRAARNLASAIGALHDGGYVVGDLNESNILITPTALVTLIDTDSFQVKGHGRSIYPCPVGKPEYTPPELQGKPFNGILRRPEHDCFGLGVLIFQLLMEGSHPFRAQWQGSGDPPSIEERIAKGWFPYTRIRLSPVAPPPNTPPLALLHPRVAHLVQRCFVDGHRIHRLRPSPDQWAEVLKEAELELITCPNGHTYSGHLRSCPQCNSASLPRRPVIAPTLQAAGAVAPARPRGPSPLRKKLARAGR